MLAAGSFPTLRARRRANVVPKAWDRRHAHAAREATKVVLMRPLVAVMDKRHEINLRAISKHAQRLVRPNAVATVRGVRQSVGKIEDSHREAKVWLRLQYLEDKVLPKPDLFPIGSILGQCRSALRAMATMTYAKVDTSDGPECDCLPKVGTGSTEHDTNRG